jgi:hypothetical protein
MARLTQISENRKSPETLLGALKSNSPGASAEAGMKLVAEAREANLGLRDYLILAIDPRLSETKEKYVDNGQFLNGFEASLAYLNLPTRNQFEHGVVMEAASETFQTFPGTRAMFPEVVDDMVKWAYRQDQIEQAAALVGSSRTINGVEMISTVVDDAAADYKVAQPIAEGARIPVRSIRTSGNTVGIWKHGMGYRTTYEFARRARIDLLTPYAARSQREIEISKVSVATSLLVNGDSVHAAAPEVNQSSFVSGTTNGAINRTALIMWLVSRAKLGLPIDTVVGNWDAYIQWLLLWMPTSSSVTAEADNVGRAGFALGGAPLLTGAVNFALSSTMTANKLVGYSKADTLEELVESGSMINESETSISNQTITYYKTENVGYRLVFGDTRSVYDFGA